LNVSIFKLWFEIAFIASENIESGFLNVNVARYLIGTR
jgi:hypothetical protein